MITSKNKTLSLSAALFATLLAASLSANAIVDDSWADGDLTKTGALDSNWWTSSSSSGIEVATGSMGLVTGNSGRGVHTVFPTQTLADIGDTLIAEYTFMTPMTVGSGSTAFKVGFFDPLTRAADLNANVSASSSRPNEVYGWGTAVNDTDGMAGPGSPPLPGYFMDMDINSGTNTDLNFRSHDQNAVFGSGRLMATNNNFSSVESSGPDEGYTFLPETEYSGSLAITRVSATEVELSGTLGTASYSVMDEFDSVDFGFFGFHVNSNRFGSTNVQNVPDNGIDFSNIKISFKAVPEPASAGLLSLAALALLGFRRR